MLRKGMIIGDRYEILEQIGSGGMSDVYKAKCHKLNRNVAIKVLKGEFREDKNFVSKFRVEAQSAAGLSHPNIVSVYDVGNESGYEYIVMELIEGITLKKYIERKGKIAVKEATSIAIQVALGIEAAHKNHIIHRDIKPQNIVISTEGKVKVTDFGIARAASANTINSNAVGSVHYISPEQARGGFVDEKSDIYSLGIVLYEMLTGKVPFEGDSTVSIALRHIQDEMPVLSETSPGIPVSISRIVEKCTQKKPEARYLKISSLISDLKKSLVMPEEDFVQISTLDNLSPTVMISEDEVSVIRSGSGSGIKEKVKGLTENIQLPDFLDDELDEDIKDDSPKMDKMIRIGAIVAGAVFVLVIVMIFFNIIGGFSNCSGGDNEPTVSSEYEEMVDVTGMKEEFAQSELEELGFKVEFEYEKNNNIDQGVVIKQSEKKGDKVKKGATITLTVSSGSEAIVVPDLTGASKEEAVKKLNDAGLKYDTIEEFSNDFEIGEIIRTSPFAGTEVEYGYKIMLYVSRGADDMTIVPNVIGKDVDVAREMMELKNLIPVVETQDVYLSDYTNNDNDKVISQSLSANSSAEKNSQVTIIIAKVIATRTIAISGVTSGINTASLVDGDEVTVSIQFLKRDNTVIDTKETTLTYVEGTTFTYPGESKTVTSEAVKYKVTMKHNDTVIYEGEAKSF